MATDETHVAVLKTVRPGREAEFESLVEQFLREASAIPRSGHAHMIRPAPGSHSRNYGFIRTFATERDRDDFYNSDFYRRWDERIAPLAEGGTVRRNIHGLEAFFRESGPAPPRWKMALLTWLGVTPTVYLFALAVGALLPQMPAILQTSIVTAAAVAILSWLIMPPLVRLFDRWLATGPA